MCAALCNMTPDKIKQLGETHLAMVWNTAKVSEEEHLNDVRKLFKRLYVKNNRTY